MTLRSASVDAFQQGRFKVLELNGAGSEPTHVYDPSISIWRTYRILANHWKEMFEIGAANRRRGVEPASLCELWRTYKNRARGNPWPNRCEWTKLRAITPTDDRECASVPT